MELIHEKRVKVRAAFDRQPVDRLEVQAVAEPRREVSKPRGVRAEQPLVGGDGHGIRRDFGDVEFHRADALRGVHHKDRAGAVRQLAECRHINPRARCIADPIERQNLRAPRQKGSDVIRPRARVRGPRHLDFHALPPQMKPGE